jgi:hypothetical protein
VLSLLLTMFVSLVLIAPMHMSDAESSTSTTIKGADDPVVAAIVSPLDWSERRSNLAEERAAIAEAHADSLADLTEPCVTTGAATGLSDAPFPDLMNTGEYEPAPQSACCKICTVGIACGNTCISANYTCRVGAGCACNSAPYVPYAPAPPPAPAITLGVQSAYPRLQLGQSVVLSLRVTRLLGPTWFDNDVGLYVTNVDEIAGALRGWDDQTRIASNHTAGLFASDQQEFRFAVQAMAPGTHRLRVAFKHRTAGWFGPTGTYWDVTVDPIAGVSRLYEGWHSRWASQSPYLVMTPGQVVEFWIVFRNVGTTSWRRGQWSEQANLALNNDDKAPFALGMAADWLWDDRLATTSELVVQPGQPGRFVFRVRAPITPGVYRLNLRPVIDGRVWLEDEGVFWVIDVRR